MQLQERKRKYQMFENTVNNYNTNVSTKQTGNTKQGSQIRGKSPYDYEQDFERPGRSSSRSNSRGGSHMKREIHSFANTPHSQANDRLNTQSEEGGSDYYHSNKSLKQTYEKSRPKSKQNMINHRQSLNKVQVHQKSRDSYNNSHQESMSNLQRNSPQSQSDHYPLSFDQLQRELAKYKSKAYDYKYKIESLNKRLQDSEDQSQIWKEKFDNEQDKTDEFFTKAEKYKILAKDFRKEIEQLKSEIEQLKESQFQEVKNYETVLRLKDEKDARITDQRVIIQQNLIESLRNLQIIASQIDQQCLLINPINQLFEIIQQIQVEDFEESCQLRQSSKSYGDSNMSQENNQMYFISDGKDQFKISTDQIMFNGESLNPDETNQNLISKIPSTKKLNSQQQPLTTQTDRHYQDYDYKTQNTNEVITPQNFKLYNNSSVSDQNMDSQMNLPIMIQTGSNLNQLHNLSQTQQSTQQQYDLLMKIQQEMTQLRQQSEKVLQENQVLSDKNLYLNDELDQHKQRNEQSLMPQYKEAFDQLRKANESMQQKIEKLENDKSQQSSQNQEKQSRQNQVLNISKIESDLKDMQNQISKITYENANLRQERDTFVTQIQNLENFNKKQEKMIKYFQQQVQGFQDNNSQINNSFNQPLKIQENYELISNNSLNKYQRKNSNNSLIQSTSTNNMRQKMTRILDQQTELDHQLAISEFSKSPNSQYLSNRTGQEFLNQNQGFTLNQVTNSDFNLTQSKMNKTNMSRIGQQVQGPALTMNQFQPNCTESDLYINTTGNDKNEVMVLEQNDNLFSLSSTQPEYQMRLSSPINYVARNIDFNLSNPSMQNQHYQLNTGNFKQSTIKDSTQYSNLQINQYQMKLNDQMNLMPMSAQNLGRPKSPIDQLRVHEIIQTQSQEVTNRDKSGGRSNLLQSTIQKSNSDLSQSQLPCVMMGQGLQYSSFIMQNNVVNENQQEREDGSRNSFKLKSNLNEYSSSDSQTQQSDKSLEQLFIQHKGTHHSSKHQSQETFQVKNINSSLNSQYTQLRQIQAPSNLNYPNFTTAQKQNNKENLIMIEDDMLFKNHQQSQQSKILSSKIKSPAFYESNHMNSDIENNIFTNNQDSYHQQQAIFNQQIVLDGLIKQVNAGLNSNGTQSDNNSYCTTDKQNTLTSGFLSGLTQSMGIQNTTHDKNIGGTTSTNAKNQLTQNSYYIGISGGNLNQNSSVQSNFMSERTMNLKKEITSLDDEILQLQNSLKQALIKKTNQLDSSIEQ
eukprot:403340359